MKNFLTKAFVCAGVLASAMALSSVAVFAADQWSYTSTTNLSSANGDFTFGGENIGELTFDANRTGSFEDKIFTTSTGTTGAAAGQKGLDVYSANTTFFDDGSGNVNNSDKKCISLTSSKNGTISLYIIRNDSGTGTIKAFEVDTANKSRSEISVTNGTVGSRDAQNVKPVEFDVVEGGIYQVYTNNGKVILMAAKLSDPVDYEYNWELNTDKITYTLSGDLKLTKSENGKTATLTYSGTDYVLKSEYASFTANKADAVGTVITTTVTPEDSWFAAPPVTLSLNDTYTFGAKTYSANDEIFDGLTASQKITYTANQALEDLSFSSLDGVTIYEKSSIPTYSDGKTAYYSVGSNGNVISFTPSKAGTFNAIVLVNSGKDGSFFEQDIPKATVKKYYYITGELEAGKTYTAGLTGSKLATLYFGFTPEESPQVSFEPYSVTTIGDYTYVVGKIEGDISEINNVGLAGSATESKVENATKATKSSDTVYKSVKAGGYELAPEADNTYYYAVKIPKKNAAIYYVKGFTDGVAGDVSAQTVEVKS